MQLVPLRRIRIRREGSRPVNRMIGAIKEKWSSMNLTIHEKEINIARKTDAAFEGGRLRLGRCRAVPQRPAV